jgi:hypothetical protein
MVSIEQRKAVGTYDWLYVPKSYNEPVANDKNYRKLQTGDEVLIESMRSRPGWNFEVGTNNASFLFYYHGRI